jgi:hypothetical protein
MLTEAEAKKRKAKVFIAIISLCSFILQKTME